MKLQRVICLYRVSTKKQVDKNENDIPMKKAIGYIQGKSSQVQE